MPSPRPSGEPGDVSKPAGDTARALLRHLLSSKTAIDVEDRALVRFCGDARCTCLYAEVGPDGALALSVDGGAVAAIATTTTAASGVRGGATPATRRAVLVKSKPVALSTAADFFACVTVAGAPDFDVTTLYALVHEAFLPGSRASDGSGGAALAEVDASLARLARGAAAARRGDAGQSTAVTSVDAEAAYWGDAAREAGGGARARDRAAAIAAALEPLRAAADAAARAPMERLLDACDECAALLDALWRLRLPAGAEPFPEPRMRGLAAAVGGALCGRVAALVAAALPLGGADAAAAAHAAAVASAAPSAGAGAGALSSALLRDAVAVGDAWLAAMSRLTRDEWPACREHAWTGPPLAAGAPGALCARAAQLLAAAGAQVEVAALLPPDAPVLARARDATAALRRLAASPAALLGVDDDAWAAAGGAHDAWLAAHDGVLAAALRQRVIALAAAAPEVAAREVARFAVLLARPAVRKALLHEREALLAALDAEVAAVDGDVRERGQRRGAGPAVTAAGAGALRTTTAVTGPRAGTSDGNGGGSDGGVVADVLACRTARARLQRRLAAARPLLGDLPAFDAFAERVADAEQRAARRQGDAFDDWAAGAERGLRPGGDLALASGSGAAGARLMEFDAAGDVVVRFSGGLVGLLRDVRALTEAGLRPPERVLAAAANAERLYRAGSAMQRAAAFYNSMGAEVVPATKPMLLAPLAAFEALVADAARGGAGTWADAKQCADFADALSSAAEAVAVANRRLRGAHARMADAVAALMRLGPVRDRDAWRAAWAGVRDAAAAGARGVAPAAAQPWLAHWDAQVYKAVEAGFRADLEALADAGPGGADVRTALALVPAARGVGFRPPLEETRAAYYRELARFVALPAALPSLVAGAGAGVHAAMVARNAPSVASAYRKAEILFARLALLRDRARAWLGLAALDGAELEDAVDAHVRAATAGAGGGSGGGVAAAFDAGFALVRAKRREAERLPDTQRVGCVVVSMLPLKAAVDAQLGRWSDALLLRLRARVAAAVDAAEVYLEGGAAAMAAAPTSLADIAAAQAKWRELADGRSAVKAATVEAEDLRRLLSTAAAGALDVAPLLQRVARLPAQWAALDASLDGFATVVDERRAALRGNVAAEARGVQARVESLAARWAAARPADARGGWGRTAVDAVFTVLDEWRTNVGDARAAADAVRASCDGFGLPPPSFDGLEPLAADVGDVTAMWETYRAYDCEREALAETAWATIRGRLGDVHDFAARWRDVVRARPRDVVTARVADEADALLRAQPALKYLRGEPFKEEHWAEALKRLGVPKGVAGLDTLMVRHVLDALPALGGAAALPWLKELHARAQGEVTVREALGEVKAWLATAEFKLTLGDARGSGGAPRRGGNEPTPLIKEWKELFTDIGDNQALLASLRDSAYFKPFADAAAAFDATLSTLDSVCASLASVQRRWVFLEPVLGRGALPAEQGRFRRVDDDFRALMAALGRNPKVSSLADADAFPNLRDSLASWAETLERCQRALAEFLEAQRSAFPRFYFLGDDDLLEILGRSSDATVVQAHLKKLFQGVHSVEFRDAGGAADGGASGGDGGGGGGRATAIVAMRSAAGEVVRLRSPVVVTEDVTAWLNAFAAEMVATLEALTVECVRGAGSAPWITRLARFPSQVHCLAEDIAFAADVEAALAAGGGAALAALRSRVAARLTEYTSYEGERGGGGAAAAALRAAQIKALVMDAIHHLDVVEQLAARDVRDAGSWHWQKQLRFYLDAGGRAVARMVDAAVEYSYEYQGNVPKLVHTPLTDKCYLVLTQGMALGYGGNPYGPAGTGKTESVKALGAAVARQVLVFNCDEGIDVQSMGRIFTGLVKCGAWGCFDEFNRLREDQLSAVSQQIQAIQAAIKEQRRGGGGGGGGGAGGRRGSDAAATGDGSGCVTLLGRAVEVHRDSGIFVTLNPAGKGYGGRSRLPDNLKQLFRPVAMAVPDVDLIAEVILRSEGFGVARSLGPKVVAAFRLASLLLSPAQHYDWGLRAIKAVLNTAGGLIAAARRAAAAAAAAPATAAAGDAVGSGAAVPAVREAELLVRAIRVNTLSKLVAGDLPRFLSILADVFPGVRGSDVDDPALEAAARAVGAAPPLSLVPDAGQLAKLLQLREAMEQRIGCVILGPSGAGKSVLWRLLAAALTSLGTPVVTHVMNPKAMPRARLLGELDHDTREWTDGVLTAAARAAVREPPGTRTWIVCDGDVDPEWIEALNSVLDDNRLLTLPNGERISLAGVPVNFLFETHELTHASPATVSRMAVIYLSSDGGDAARVVRGWLAAQPADAPVRAHSALLEATLGRAQRWLRDECPRPPLVPSTPVSAAASALSQVAGAECRADVAVGLVRGLCGCLPPDAAAALARELYGWAGERAPDAGRPLDVTSTGGPAGALRALAVDRRGVAAATGEPLTRADALAGAVVLTGGLARAAAAVAPWMARGEPLLLAGPEGAGKALLVRHLVAQRRSSTLAVVHCTSSTTPEHVVAKIRAHCVLQSGARGRVFRPRDGADRVVLYLRDVDLPTPDRYGTSALVAFLTQLLTHRGFHDEHREFLLLDRVQIVASVATGGAAAALGRHALSPRFAAAMRVAAVDAPEPSELAAVAGAYLTAALGSGAGAVVAGDARFAGPGAPAALQKLAQAMVDVFAGVCARFTVDDAPHYTYSPRDLHAWVGGVLTRYDVSGEPSLFALVGAEGARVFRSRLVCADDGARFDALLAAAFKAAWGAAAATEVLPPPDAVFTTLGGARGSGGAGGTAPLLRRTPVPAFRALVERGLATYEREERELGLVLFSDALDALAATDRVLSQPGGCLMLAGAAGAGRRSAATLVAHMHGTRVVSPVMGRGFGLKHLLTELKPAVLAAGTACEACVLLLEDRHLAAPGVLEAVNALLAGGEVPGMWAGDELEPLLAPLREALWSDDAGGASGGGGGGGGATARRAAAGGPSTPLELFTSRVRAHVHVVLVMDPSHAEFAARAARNPAISGAGRCVIHWVGGWRAGAERDVAAALLAEPLAAHAASVAPDALLDVLLGIHASAPRPRAPEGASGDAVRDGAGGAPPAPRELVSLLRGFRVLVARLAARAGGESDRLAAGLAKLVEAAASVDDLARSAEAQRAELRTKRAAADAAMREITDALSEASSRRREVEVLQEGLAGAERETRARRAAIEEELSGVQPVLDAARAAVGGIKREHLDEIRSLKVPPEAVADVLSAVLLMLGNADTSWLSMKRFLSGRGVKEDIIGFDARRSLNADARRAVNKLVASKAASFEEAVITRASVAAAPMAVWVKANLKYAAVLEGIAPLEATLASANAELERAQAAVGDNATELARLDGRVEELKSQFGARTAEAEAVKLALAKSEDTLARAGALLEGLAGERGRWQARAEAIRASRAAIPLQAALAAGFVAYLGCCSEAERAAAVAAWTAAAATAAGAGTSAAPRASLRRLPREGGGDSGAAAPTLDFDLRALLSSESEQQAWRAAGLPPDALSAENAVVALAGGGATGRVPLLVDPDGGATAWLQRHLGAAANGSGADNAPGGGTGGGPLEVVSASDPRLHTAVELAVRFGKTLLLRDVEAVEPFLTPLLRREYAHQGGPRSVVSLGDKAVDVHDRFRLFLATRDAALRPPPDVEALLLPLHFTVTRSGLESQLLSAALAHDAPELEARKAALVRRCETLKAALAAVEDDLLGVLASSSGSLIDNAALVSSLQLAKAKAAETAAALAESVAAAAELDAQRAEYAPLAAVGSRLYFCVQELRGVNHMYQFSLRAFVGVFARALDAPRVNDDGGAGGGGGRAAVVAGLCAALRAAVLHAVGGGLFKDDRLAFALHLARAAAPAGDDDGTAAPGLGGPHAAAWRLLLADAPAAALAGNGGGRGDAPPWVPRARMPAYAALVAALPGAPRLLTTSGADAAAWAAWAASPAPERSGAGFPAPAASPLLRLLLVLAVRPDRALAAMTAFACAALGVATLSPPPASFAALADDAAGGGECGGRDSGGGSDVEASAAATTTFADTPLLLVTTTGADPSRELADFAEATVGRDAFAECALGGGAGGASDALLALRAAAAGGSWLCLKNLHLVTPWLPELERELGALPSPHPRFRLWLTTEAHTGFPPQLLQRCRKATFEAPPGVRSNLEGTLAAWGGDFLLGGGAVRAHLLFALAWLHAAVQERRSYVPQGWTKAYEFSPADLRAGAAVVDALLSRAAATAAGAGGGRPAPGAPSSPPVRVPWAFLHGLLEAVVYGGRVDASSDVRVLRAYLSTVLHPDVLAGKRPLAAPAAGGGPPLLLPGTAGVRAVDFDAVVAALPDGLGGGEDADDSGGGGGGGAGDAALLGLPRNVDVGVQRAAAARTVAALRALRNVRVLAAAGGGGGGVNRDAWRSGLAPVLDAWARAFGGGGEPAAAGAPAASAPAPPPRSSEPLAVFLEMEAALGERVRARVGSDLAGLRRVLLVGSGALTPALLAVAHALLGDAVPDAWAAEWPDGPAAATPPAWLAAVAARRDGVAALLRRIPAGVATGAGGASAAPAGAGGGAARAAAAAASAASVAALLGAPVALSALFRPAAFLNALRQQTARSARVGGAGPPHVSVDGLRLVAAWETPAGAGGGRAASPLAAAAPTLPVTVTGLHMQGAAVDAAAPDGLADVSAAAGETTPLPPLVLAWVLAAAPDLYPAATSLALPLYQTLDRERLVAEVTLPCGPDRVRWVLAGACLVVEGAA